MINSRTEIQHFLLEVEKKFPVNQWKVGNVHLWPFIRIKLFFYLIILIEKSDSSPIKTKPEKKGKERIKADFKKLLSVFHYYKWLYTLPIKKNLFVGADAHRVDYRQTRFNRYFDILIEKYNLSQNSMYFEYGINTHKQFNSSLIFTFSKALNGFLFLNKFLKIKGNVQMEGYEDFLDYLKKEKQFTQFSTVYSTKNFSNWGSLVCYPRVVFFKKVLTKIKPERVVILCYYLDDIMALIAAANQLKIETIEMQHGPQTAVHMAYSSWFTLPTEGYDMLPRNYWCWDENSKNVLQEWTKSNKNYAVKVIGNPWIDYWKTKEKNNVHTDYILYSLQPSPLTLEQLFPESIINFIKENPFPWFIRLHPRQLKEMEVIKKFLEDKQILHLVTIDAATNDPLPLLLSNALIHITHFSGTAIEASLFNVFTVLLNEIGKLSFQDLISAQKAVYLDVNSLLFSEDLRKSIKNKAQFNKDVSIQNNLKEHNLFD
jgi:hypothetical protein